MKKLAFKLNTYLCVFILMISCQNVQYNSPKNSEKTLSSDDGKLDLSRSTIEQQNFEKAQAEKFLLEARAKRIIVEPDQTDKKSKRSEINIALYARQTVNSVGEKIYNRIGAKVKKSNVCLRFISAEDAQRFFLEKNGPEKDFWNLDPDGDGFACQWDPQKYRKLFVRQTS